MNYFKKEKKILNQHINKDLIKDLAATLKEYGDKILSEEVTFSLNASSLTYLNNSLSHISVEEKDVTFDVVPANNSKLSFHHDLQFLYDFIQKISALKLNHGNSTLQGRFNICRFRSLKNLEIKKIPIHLVVGLQHLRPKLEAICCSRSLQNLEGLFKQCGGDLSQPFTWCELKNANLSYNGIEFLDDSLKLLPYLEMLNLGHNNIKRADNLQHLTVLKHLSLAYNCLNACPVLSNSCRGTLVSLNLCYNNLESLNGIDELYALEDLDLSGNCLICHSVLKKVMFLNNLKYLNLTENPMSYHKSHRKYSIKYLHPHTVKKKFLLDGKYLNHEEETFVRETQVFSISSRVSNGRIYAEIDENKLQPSASHTSLHTTTHPANKSLTDLDTSLEYAQSPMQRRKKKSSKITDAVILDPTELDVADSTPSINEKVVKSPEEHLKIKTKVENAREKFGQEWLIASKRNIGLPTRNDSFDSADAFVSSCKSDNLHPKTSSEDVLVPNTTDLASATKQVVNHASNMYDTSEDFEDSSRENSPAIENAVYYVVHRVNYEDDSPCIISIGSRYIVEKDSMTGKIFDELDLHSLVRYEQTNQGEESFSLLLSFDYVKKSRRERTYNFENGDELDSFMKHLEPFILKKNVAALSRDALQCLKCGAQFYKESAASKLKTVDRNDSEDQAVYPSSNKQDNGYLVEVVACPNCDSEMVVEIDMTLQAAIPNRQASTPLSSSIPELSFEASIEASEIVNDEDLIRTLMRRISDEKLPKMLNNDAVVYSYQNSCKNEIEVEAEVYNQHSSIDNLDLKLESDSYNLDQSVSHNEITRTDSDVSILSNPSQSSIAVLSTQMPPVDTNCVQNFTSMNSSSESASTTTEKSVYEISNAVPDQASSDQGIDSSISISENNSVATSDVSTAVENTVNSSYCFTDLDSRIKLHLSMTLFGKDEDFRGLLKAGVVPYQKLKEFEGGILLSNKTVYILKVIGPFDFENLPNHLQTLDSKNFNQLKSISILCGRQGFQLNFDPKGKSTVYNILTRDGKKCSDFVGLFIEVLEHWSRSSNLPIPTVYMATKDTLRRIHDEIFCYEEGEILEDQCSVSLYVMGWWKQNNANMITVSFIFTPLDIYIAEDNYEWPIPQNLANSENPKTGQFKLLSQQKIINLKEIKCDVEKNDTEAEFLFDDDSSTTEVIWHIRMDTIFSLDAVIKAIKKPWEQLFGVDLNISSKIESP